MKATTPEATTIGGQDQQVGEGQSVAKKESAEG